MKLDRPRRWRMDQRYMGECGSMRGKTQAIVTSVTKCSDWLVESGASGRWIVGWRMSAGVVQEPARVDQRRSL
jgi:hypothetical protein